MKKLLGVLGILLVLAGLGCATLSHVITPAELDATAIAYVVEAGIANPGDYEGYQNLLKASRLMQDVKNGHQVNLLELAHLAEAENLTFSILEKSTFNKHQVAVQREEALFGPTGLLALGLTMAGAGTFTGLIGLSRKRPGDVTKEEMEQALLTVSGKTNEELTLKEKQFLQLIQGTQKYMSIAAPADVRVLKECMNESQDTETKVAVASAKIV